MEKADKIALLKELEFYSCLLKKHETLRKEQDRKSAIAHQARTNQNFNKSGSFHSYKAVKNQRIPVSCFTQNYLYKKPIHLADQNKGNGLYNKGQSYNSKYSLSKSKVLNNISSANKFVFNSKNLNSDAHVGNSKSISNFKSDSHKASCTSNEFEKSTYNAKDFMKEVESLTELLKKKTSKTPQKCVNSMSKYNTTMQNKQFIHKKQQNSTFDNIKLMKKGTALSKVKCSIQLSTKSPGSIICPNRKDYFINSRDKNNSLQEKAFKVNKFVYLKDNVNKPLNRNGSTYLKKIKTVDESKDSFSKVIRPKSRKVIFNDSKNLSCDLRTYDRTGVCQKKPLTSGNQEIIMKLHTTNKIISSTRKVLKKQSYVNKIKSPASVKGRYNAVKVPKITKLKQSNTRYAKINKHLTPPNKIIQLRHNTQLKSLKKIKRKVKSKYKVINKTLTPSSEEKRGNFLSTKKSLPADCDTFLKALNDSAVEKLEQNLLAISSELTAPLSPKMKDHNSLIKPLLSKDSPAIGYKNKPFRKSKSRISKYKVINSNVLKNYSVKNAQSVHMLASLRREKKVLVRRLFKSKNVIINKNASSTSYSAKLIKSKYLSLNKRKSCSWQKYINPIASQSKVKGSYLTSKLGHKQKRFKTNSSSAYHSSFTRKKNCRWKAYKPTHRNRQRLIKNKIKNRCSYSPVVFIRGTQYAMNLNGKTLKKVPIKGHTVKNFQKTSTKYILRNPESLTKVIPASATLASRVLHRSINRILTASSKKKLLKINTYCMFYNRFGRCNKGVKCTYIHDPSKIAVCTRFLRGTCKIDGCPFSHEVSPGKMAVCSFFLVGQCSKANCPYRHEKLAANAVLCKDFVQGYCPSGKECKKAHILMCPKYMHGECDQGSSCAFPHPPQKAKKNIQKETEDQETKPTEVLLEKVLRYFQQGGESHNELNRNAANLFVPKQRKLEEQPSFIPLSNSSAVI